MIQRLHGDPRALPETLHPPEGEPSFRPRLHAFAGPLDLLLHLIHKNEIDIFDIPIALILDQYLEHLALLESAGELDLVNAGEFLVMATRLMEIKSRLLLPTDVELAEDEPLEEEIEDPRTSLVEQLLEYKEIKERAVLLQEVHTLRQNRFERRQHLTGQDPEQRLDVSDASTFDLCAAFQRVLDELRARRDDVKIIEIEDVPIEEIIHSIIRRLEGAADRSMSFRSLFSAEMPVSLLIGHFLAVLEMARLRVLRIRQERQLGDIQLELREIP